MNANARVGFRYNLVSPDMPAPEEYLPLLREMHASGRFSNFGPLVTRFEQQLLASFGNSDEACVTACNATAGLSAALLATGRPGPVLLPAFTFPASLGAVCAAGMVPVVMDVAPDTWAMDPDTLAGALSKTGATVVMPVIPFGIRQDFEGLIACCRQLGVPVVLDNAAGLGGGRHRTGPDEHVFEVFSMHATKPFAIGEGGAVFAHHSHAAALRGALGFALTTYDQPGGPLWGFNGKLSEFHAAVGLAQLARYPATIRARQAFVRRYQELLRAYPELVFPEDSLQAPWPVFPVLLPDQGSAERFVAQAGEAGLEIRRYYRPSLSLWPETQVFGACPVAEDLASRMCALPVRAIGPDAEEWGLLDLVVSCLARSLPGRDSGGTVPA